jgi:predicted MPP superfamily phosphohydrolase
MNTQTERTLIEKLNQLPPELVAEVEDFVDFLRSRNEQRQLVQAAMKASEPAFAAVWSNPDDSVYDTL